MKLTITNKAQVFGLRGRSVSFSTKQAQDISYCGTVHRRKHCQETCEAKLWKSWRNVKPNRSICRA